MIGRFLPWTAGTAAWNMAVDEALLTTYIQGTAPVTLRFYGWDPPALSLGYLQKPLSTARQARCRQAGVEWVRRPTGGRAVFHQHEITYALVTGGARRVLRFGFGGLPEDWVRLAARFCPPRATSRHGVRPAAGQE